MGGPSIIKHLSKNGGSRYSKVRIIDLGIHENHHKGADQKSGFCRGISRYRRKLRKEHSRQRGENMQRQEVTK